MGTTLTGEFATRREAEMTVERLVQEYGIDRSRIMVAASGTQNSAGEERAGSDGAAGAPTPASRDDAALHGDIVVAVEFDDESVAGKVREAFSEFAASSVEKGSTGAGV